MIIGVSRSATRCEDEKILGKMERLMFPLYWVLIAHLLTVPGERVEPETACIIDV